MNLIPEPQEITYTGFGEYPLSDKAILSMPLQDFRLQQAASAIFPDVTITNPSYRFYALYCGSIVPDVLISTHSDMPDAYQLCVTDSGICLTSPTAAGLFYGMKTLGQIISNAGDTIPCLTLRDWAATALRCDHYDLRTVHPTFTHLLQYIEEMAQYKFNGLLIEYEDKFPFRSKKELRHPHALTEEQLQQLLAAAYENFIEVIPLQQTYGHLEYALKHPSYITLREQVNAVAELCPLNPYSYEFVCSLIQDMAAMHPHSRYVHLGGDEVWSIGTCDDCKASGLTKAMLFIQFMNRLADFTLQLGKTPILWHDMLRDATDEELNKLDKRITIAVWIYSGRHMDTRISDLVHRLLAAGFHVLGAPSVRCWDECAGQNYPVAERRLENINVWIHTASHTPIDGLIFTNWSASLALGNPYGLFESTRYLSFLGCELAWNPNASKTTYPMRFFSLYHGITDPDFLAETLSLTDYYLMPDQYRPLCTKNELTARLLDIMRQYEVPTKSGLPLQDLLFRGAYLTENEEVHTFLREKYLENYAVYDALYPEMQQLFEELLPPHLAEIYLYSRFYLPELYKKAAYSLLHL